MPNDDAAYPGLVGMTIVATPAKTHTSPIMVVGASVSPRKATPTATPIGTLRYACDVVATDPSVRMSRK